MRYPNFYECLEEAHARLLRTTVLYEGRPYYILAITDHKNDGIFRTWLAPIENVNLPVMKEFTTICVSISQSNPSLGDHLDKALEKNPDAGVLRKHMNSPKFNRFRPFPLGMCNVDTQVYFIERQPIRPKMEQGLTKTGLYETLITSGSRQDNPRKTMELPDMFSEAFKTCITGDHLSFDLVLDSLMNPKVVNDALAFHREFALVRGPLEMLFLAYRTEIIGVLAKNNKSELRLGREFKFCHEVVDELGVFDIIL